MDTLERIIAPVKKEMQAFEDNLRKDLTCESSEMQSVIDYVLSQKGKRIRPLLVFLSAAATGTIGNDTFIGASAIEMLHSATLIHDDVVDEADMRRGHKSVKSKWTSKVAVLGGDFFLARALHIVSSNKLYDLLNIMTLPISKMSEGELMQMENSDKLVVSEGKYFEIIDKKTAALIAASMSVGAKSAGASDEDTEKMLQIGENIGIAFQIIDDMLDYKSTNLIGKPTGNDIVERKITLPLIYALSHADKATQKNIIELIRNAHSEKKNVSKVRDFVISNGGLEYSVKVAGEYIAKATEKINELKDTPAKKALKELSDFFVSRNK